ncbi:MAG: hypothetical protein IKG32_09225 [Clostridia bacterium]|nr:hypothetical protein [Clostridia bacterium]
MEKAEYKGNDGFLQRDNKVWQSGNCDICANIASGTVYFVPGVFLLRVIVGFSAFIESYVNRA